MYICVHKKMMHSALQKYINSKLSTVHVTQQCYHSSDITLLAHVTNQTSQWRCTEN